MITHRGLHGGADGAVEAGAVDTLAEPPGDRCLARAKCSATPSYLSVAARSSSACEVRAAASAALATPSPRARLAAVTGVLTEGEGQTSARAY